MGSLEGKVAVVTGAASKRGMGHRVAVRLAEAGANVAIMDKFAAPQSIWPGDEDWGGLETVASEVKALGKEALPLVVDVSKGKDVESAVAKIMEIFGKIDILVHCGGIRGSMTTPIVDLSEDEWRSMLDINLTGSFLISKAVLGTPNGSDAEPMPLSLSRII